MRDRDGQRPHNVQPWIAHGFALPSKCPSKARSTAPMSSALPPVRRACSHTTAESEPAEHRSKSHSAANSSSRIRSQWSRLRTDLSRQNSLAAIDPDAVAAVGLHEGVIHQPRGNFIGVIAIGSGSGGGRAER